MHKRRDAFGGKAKDGTEIGIAEGIVIAEMGAGGEFETGVAVEEIGGAYDKSFIDVIIDRDGANVSAGSKPRISPEDLPMHGNDVVVIDRSR